MGCSAEDALGTGLERRLAFMRLKLGRFSIKWIMLAIAIAAVPLSMLSARIHAGIRQKAAVRQIEAIGGQAIYEDRVMAEYVSLIQYGPPRGQAWRRFEARLNIPRILGRDFTWRVVAVGIPEENPSAGPFDWTILRDLPHLRSFTAPSSSFTDKDFSNLKDCKGLQLLMLRDTDVTDEAVPMMLQFQELGILDLAGTRISDKSSDNLCELIPQLELLDVRDTDITIVGATELMEVRLMHDTSVLVGTRNKKLR